VINGEKITVPGVDVDNNYAGIGLHGVYDSKFDRFIMTNKLFEEVAKREGFYTDELMLNVSDSGTVIGHSSIPEKWQQIFKTAMDISWF
jgi:ribonucleotide reductase alpha subunit